MKLRKYIYLFITLFLLSSVSASLTTFNENDMEKDYFSLSDPIINVESDLNESLLFVNYTIQGDSKLQNYCFGLCPEDVWCTQFSLLDLFELENNTLSGSTVFNLFTLESNLSKQIYLDFDRPTFSLDDAVVDLSDKTLNLSFNYSDSISGIYKVELFTREGSSLSYVDDLTNLTFYQFDIENSGNLTLLFNIEDVAGNTRTFEQTFLILDIFDPTILSSRIIIDDDLFKLYFEAEDEDLQSYSIRQGTIQIQEDITGERIERTVTVPFSSGNFNLTVEDIQGNFISEQFSLDNRISITNLKEFSSTGTFSFTSRANSCFIEEVSGENFDEEMNKNGRDFSIRIRDFENEKVKVKFRCDQDSIREYFEVDFTYDTNPPSVSVLSASKTSNGGIKLSWTESVDNFGDVRYKILRDSEEINSLTSLSFTDSNVLYPNSYEYIIESRDVAGNSISSNSISIIPEKVSIQTFESNLEREQETDQDTYLFTLQTDPDTTTTVSQYFQNDLLQSWNFSDSQISQEILLADGLNEIRVSSRDVYGNSKSEIFYVTRFVPLAEVEPEVVIEPEINQSTQPATVRENNKTSFGVIFLWLIFVLLLIGLLFYLFFINKENIKRYFAEFERNSNVKDRKRKQDLMLGRNLHNVRKERIKKQEEIKRRKELEKTHKEKASIKSEYHSKKLKDISSSRKIDIPLEQRKRAQKRVKTIKKESMYDVQPKKKQGPSFIESILSLFSLNKSPEKKQDHLDEYLSKKSSKAKEKKSKQVDNSIENQSQSQEPPKDKLTSNTPSEQKTENNPPKEEVKPSREKPQKLSLDDYLSKRSKKKRRYFAEKEVESDLKRRGL